MNSNWFKVIMRLNKVNFGNHMTLKGIPVIFNKKGATLKIGNDVTVKSSFLSNLVGLYSRSIIVTRIPGAVITIGNRVGMSGVVVYARKEITIGDDTLIGGNTKIIDNDFHPIDMEARINNDPRKIGTRPIHIGKNCFIGCNVLILKGTELGDGCIVGAGAVVSGKFPKNSIIVGNPAKIIKSLK
ncbi:acyltransferase [Lacticaseibacillus paracasei]|uniref:acyltransferase n=1 Tax=Lacticaseibacillus paracasei TaxID=1597 RepID=UPI0037DFC9BB